MRGVLGVLCAWMHSHKQDATSLIIKVNKKIWEIIVLWDLILHRVELFPPSNTLLSSWAIIIYYLNGQLTQITTKITIFSTNSCGLGFLFRFCRFVGEMNFIRGADSI